MTELDAFMKALDRNTRSNDALRESVDRLTQQLARIEGAAQQGPRVSVEDASAPEDPIDIVASAGGRVVSEVFKRWAKTPKKKG